MIKKIVDLVNGEIGCEVETENKYTNSTEFVNWCMIEAFGEEKAKELVCQPNKELAKQCCFSAKYYKNNAQYYSMPKTGDQVFFKNDKKEIVRTGIVSNVDENKIYTVELIDNVVCAPMYAKNDYAIAGYGRPNYEELTEEEVIDNEEDKDIVLAPLSHDRSQAIKGENDNEIDN